MNLLRVIVLSGLLFQAAIFIQPPSAAAAPPSAEAVASYYPHWVSRDGTLSRTILSQLAPGTIIGVHHYWSLAELRRILDAPGRFKIAWYIEANVQERNDPLPPGTSVAQRIAEARRKQNALAAVYGADRFVDLVELDGARDKYEGQLRGKGNAAGDWVRDAAAAKAAGFRYIAKSPTKAHVQALRARFGSDFVPRIVFEDVTGSSGDRNPGYRADARALAGDGARMTLIVHEGAYGGFPATPLGKARSIVRGDFSGAKIEAYWGRANSRMRFVKLKDFASTETARASPARTATASVRAKQ